MYKQNGILHMLDRNKMIKVKEKNHISNVLNLMHNKMKRDVKVPN